MRKVSAALALLYDALVEFQNPSSRLDSTLDVPAQGFCQMPKSTVPH